jgi:hypothetical protein
MGFITNWEDDLIPPDQWGELYHQMPEECQRLIDNNEQGVGIGRNTEYGWFTAFCGQGPVMDWYEKKHE